MKTYRVPVTVTMTGWVEFQAEGDKEARMVAESMSGQVIRPAWEAILKGRKESYVVDTEKVSAEEAVYEFA